ncbi:MAG TPA: ATP-binding protein [Blastocatellia bacterium]|jgi:PAS domain S-box-containing protein|nr:ATP-binding protein [Blastocatellia bacterium]
MKKLSNLKLIIFFVLLTLSLTLVVVFAWEQVLMKPLYNWFDAAYPGPESADHRWRLAQRVEHSFISIVVDTIVVTLLLGLVDRKQRDLLSSEERYRAIFEHANDGVGVVTAFDHRLVDGNKKFGDILGYTQQSLIGRDICEVLKGSEGSDLGGLSATFECTFANRTELAARIWEGEREIKIQTRSGAPLSVAVSCSLLSAGRQKLFVLIIRDLTEQKEHEREKQEMQRQLYQASKLASVGELSAGVAHEINNPLNCIINFAQLLKDDNLARNESQRRMMDGIIDEGERIAKIVRDLLTFARHDPPAPTRVNIAECVENSFSLFGHQLQKDGITVEVDIPDDLLFVLGDASRLRQVVLNMISNAHHALRAKPSEQRLFKVRARNQNRGGKPEVRIEFHDNGVGIQAENLEKVFDPFFTTRRDSGGTGLGLSLSFGIIQNSGGSIRVESEEGSYTKFIIELPALEGTGADYGESIASGRRAEHTMDNVGVSET